MRKQRFTGRFIKWSQLLNSVPGLNTFPLTTVKIVTNEELVTNGNRWQGVQIWAIPDVHISDIYSKQYCLFCHISLTISLGIFSPTITG